MGDVVYRFGAVDRTIRTRTTPTGARCCVAAASDPEIDREGVDHLVPGEQVVAFTSMPKGKGMVACAEMPSLVATGVSDRDTAPGQETPFIVINCGFLGVWAGLTDISASK